MYDNPNAVRKSDTASASQPARQTQVQEQVSRSQRVTERMEVKIKALYERLQAVLSERAEGASQESPRPTLVGHATALSNHNDQLEHLDSAMGDILDRLEL